MNQRSYKIAPLLFFSGFCALVYQTAWLREFRLIFGASTAATAAVLGIFMGSIGLGSALLGKRSENKSRPLAFYAQLELLIALSAALTPALAWLVRHAYIGMGGTMALGITLGTVVRLALTAVVIGLPTFLMGGTLPAAARAAMDNRDESRRSLALLYGVNSLGAVAGVALTTFFLLETFGNHLTLWLAAALNALVAVTAFAFSKTLPEAVPASEETEFAPSSSASPAFVLGAAAIVGFAFLLMELVWYRMLGPLLGGSAFTFGLILATALLGIGSGGAAYSLCGNRRPSLQLFAFTCAFEALCLAAPFALGDRLATLAMLLRPLGTFGFSGFIAGWAVVCAIVVFPAAFVSGVQFPMLIALLGNGNKRIGSQTGLAYAWNTAGAIAGSLAGGFGFLPLFTAPGTWKLVVALLCALGTVAAWLAARRTNRSLGAIPSAGTALFALWLITCTGPTAWWRHSEIGTGRVASLHATENELHDLINSKRRDYLWEADGLESSVAVRKANGLSFIVNGKCDGNVKEDAGTQVMSGLIGAALHEKPENALVVGLGTGSTAGWLAAVPSMKKVDVFEMEPSILRFARECAAVNHDAMSNPKLHVAVGDGRELLLTSRERYDLIVSEPSNPYRAGVAGLFTTGYYQSAADRLRDGGFFLQWMQAYNVDNETIRTVYATLHAVFPCVETWQTAAGDLLLVASKTPVHYDVPALRARLAQEPFKSALANVWHVTDLEGFLAHYVANGSLGRGFARRGDTPVNTDDRTVLEFAFARGMVERAHFDIPGLRASARLCHADRPETLKGEVDWESVEDQRISMALANHNTPAAQDYYSADQRLRAAAFCSYIRGELDLSRQQWLAQKREPVDLNELLLVAECLADAGDTKATLYIDKLKETLPDEATAITAKLLVRQQRWDEAADALEITMKNLHHNPWPPRDLTQRTLRLAVVVAEHGEVDGMRMYQALQTPFCAYASEQARVFALLGVGMRLDHGNFGHYSLAGIESQEPNIPWQASFLTIREACYRTLHDPRAGQARRDLQEFTKDGPQPAALDAAVAAQPSGSGNRGYELGTQAPTPPRTALAFTSFKPPTE